jgi:cytolysin (calcineurin-like family phosphatase)
VFRRQHEQSFFGPGATEEEVAFFYNLNLTAALNTIKDAIGLHALGGVIVNGDLTEFGKQGSDVEDYIDIYDLGVSANVDAGLGNHDYANNVDDCFTNFCASAMVTYFADQVSSLNVIDFDYSVQQTPLVGIPSVRYDYVGSLAYSFEIGDIHFVQLNNCPTYTRWATEGPDRRGRVASFDRSTTVPVPKRTSGKCAPGWRKPRSLSGEEPFSVWG